MNDYEDSLRLRDVYWGMVNSSDLLIMKWLQLASTRLQLQHSEHEKRAFNTFLTARTDKLPCTWCIDGQTFEPKLTIQATENDKRYLRSTVQFRKYPLGPALFVIQYVGN